MDVADAVNVMLYASDRADGQPGCAVWDLFRAEDADEIRKFLKRRYDTTHSFTDPIHSQLFYLDAKARKDLAEKYNVVSWRVYQYPVRVYILQTLFWLKPRVKRSLYQQDVRIKFVIWPIVSRLLLILSLYVSCTGSR